MSPYKGCTCAARRLTQLLVLTCTLHAGRLAAQAPTVDPLQPVCPAGRSPRVDTTQVVVALEPAKTFRDSAYSDAQRQQIAYYADAIARRFAPPPSLGDIPTLVDLPAYYEDGADDGGRSVLGGRLVLIVRRDGKLKTLAWEYFPLARPLAEAVVAATRAADAGGDFDGIMRASESKADDTLAIDIRSRLETDTPAFPLMRARLPGYRGETLAMVEKRGYMQYPPSAAQQRVGTRGEVRFVVGTDGRAVAPFTQVTRAGWRDFVDPMRRAVASSTFIPATSGGCKVPALVRQPFTYEIRR